MRVKTIAGFIFSLGDILSFKDTGHFIFTQNLHSLLSHQAKRSTLLTQRLVKLELKILELNLARDMKGDMKGYMKGFYRSISSKRYRETWACC